MKFDNHFNDMLIEALTDAFHDDIYTNDREDICDIIHVLQNSDPARIIELEAGAGDASIMTTKSSTKPTTKQVRITLTLDEHAELQTLADKIGSTIPDIMKQSTFWLKQYRETSGGRQ